MAVAFDELRNFLLGKWVSENPGPLHGHRIGVQFDSGRGSGSGPLAIEAARAERRELGGFPEPNGLQGGVTLRIGVPEIEGKIRMERSGRIFLWLRALL